MEQAEHSPTESRPRVLHVIGSLALGGIETWLMHMFRRQKDFAVQHEVLVTKTDPGPYEAEARKLGIPIHRLDFESGKLRWFGRFRRFLREAGPFTAVHSHAEPLFAAPLLEVAKSAGIPIRIAHSHSARSQGKDFPLHYRIAHLVRVPWFNRTATRKVGITEAAIEEIAGSGWRSDPIASILIYGFDFGRHRDATERALLLRKSLGIPDDAPVIGHVARFNSVKNHKFLVDAFAETLRVLPEAHLVMVGQGPLRDQVRAQADSLGIADSVHFPGTTDDVPAYMAMFDLFALPSFSEGLGIVAVEAQAAGTPAIVSDTTPKEAAVVPGAVEFLPLAAGSKAWGEAIALRLKQPPGDPVDWLAQVEASRFGIRRCIDELDEIYRSELERAS